MNCPFCGEELREGALQTQKPRDQVTYHWVPPVSGNPPAPDPAEDTPSPVRKLLKKAPPAAQAAVDRAEQLWNREDWDVKQAVALTPQESERGWKDVLFTGKLYFRNTWYCPKCEKALCVFDKAEDTPQNAYLDQTEPPEPPQTPPPPPKSKEDGRRDRPKDDPWEKKGLFRKKPDWER